MPRQPRRHPESPLFVQGIVERWQALCEGWRKNRAERFGLPYEKLWPVLPLYLGLLTEIEEPDRVMILWCELSPQERLAYVDAMPDLAYIPDGMVSEERECLERLNWAEREMRFQHRRQRQTQRSVAR